MGKAKDILLLKLDVKPDKSFELLATQDMRATWDSIIQKEQEIDAALASEPDYNGSHLRVADQMFDLIGSREYRDRRTVERLACHAIVTMSMIGRERDEKFGETMRQARIWFARFWRVDGSMGGDLLCFSDAPSATELSELPKLDRIDVWSTVIRREP